MNLTDYLNRINYSAPLRVDLATLNGLIEAHVRAVPFENLDIYAERPVEWSLEAAYDEIVTRKQGGWCFEMNTLFEWVLSEIGFDVTRLSGGVRREKAGDIALGNHLCLLVSLDRDYLVDVGFGGSQISAIALEEAETLHRPLRMALLDAGDGYWRMHEGGWRSAMSYDFRAEPGDNALLQRQHDVQVEDPNSIFRKTMTAKIRRGRSYHTLRGQMLETNHPGSKEAPRIIVSVDEMRTVLRDLFGLEEPDLERLWPMLTARRKQMFPRSDA